VRQQLLPVQLNWLPPVGTPAWKKFRPEIELSTREMGTTVLTDQPSPSLPNESAVALYRVLHEPVLSPYFYMGPI